MRQLIAALALLLLAGLGFATEASTTIAVGAGVSPSPLNHTTQVALTSSEVIVVFTSTPALWTFVQMTSPSAWTLRSTQGSTTDAIPVLANQVVTLMITGTGQTFYPVGSGSQTLYVIPLTYSRPAP